MNVKLVHRTDNAEALIVRMARVSAPENADNMETGPRLLRYLISHKHWSPLEMASMCVQIETERDIAAQLLRHRSFSFQEFSTRYAVAQHPVMPDYRRQDTKNRQNSFDDLDPELKLAFDKRTLLLFGEVQELYNDMIEAGVAKETARRILPLSTASTLFMHGTLRSWVHYIELRTDAGTQLEHRLIAEEIKSIFMEQFPIIGEAAFGS